MGIFELSKLACSLFMNVDEDDSWHVYENKSGEEKTAKPTPVGYVKAFRGVFVGYDRRIDEA